MNPLAHYHLLIERLRGPDGDVEAAVAAFVRPIAASGDPEEIEALLEIAWDLLVAAALDTPDRLQHRLVGLVTGVRAEDVPGVRVWAQRVLRDLPIFGERMRQAWDEPHEPDDWVRLNAFAARLTAGVTDFLPLGLRSIATALETPRPAPGSVPAAAEWFRHAGEQLVAATVHGRTYAGRLGDPAERAEGGFGFGRWARWRARLDELARDGDPAARDGFRLIRRFDTRIAAHYHGA
jgi:hypothetical protein